MEIVGDVVDEAWDAYVHSNELEAQRQYEQDMAVIDFWEATTSSPVRFVDFLDLSMNTALTYASYVALVSNPTISGAFLFVVGLFSYVWSLLDYNGVVEE